METTELSPLPDTGSAPTKEDYQRLSVDELMPDPVNPRKGNVKAIADSLREFGQHRPVVVQRSTRRVIAGNHLLKAAKLLGWSEVDCILVDDDDLKATRRGLVDNRVGDLATWDEDVLKTLLPEAGDDLAGFDDAFIDKVMKDAQPKVEEPTYPIAPKFSEKYEAVVIFASNETDWTFIQTVLNLQKKKSWKSTAVGLCHVLTAEEFAKLWRARG